MSAEVLDWRASEEPRDIVHRVVECLAQGGVVTLPTETVYGIGASLLAPEAVERLVTVKGRDEGKPFAIALKGPEEALDWVPHASPLGRRLMRRCWPGPITLVFPLQGDSLVSQLDDRVRRRICPQGTIGLRVPAHAGVLEVLRLLPAPLALTSANISGKPPAVTGEEVVAQLAERVDLIVDDGRCRYAEASTVVYVAGGELQVLREGVINETVVRRLARFVILFVCTGNTCRSPMAEALCRKLLSERLSCRPEELPDRGYEVLSAGIAALEGAPSTPEAMEVVRERGADLTGHVARYVTTSMLRQADLIVCMTPQHLDAVLDMAPDVADRARLLRPDGGSVADPIGGSIDVYRRCATQIEESLRVLLAELIS